MDLLSRKCSPVASGTKPLTRKEIATLLREVPEWSFENNHLYRRFTFKSFKESAQFFNRVVALAEEEGHPLDICISESRHVDIILYTHPIGGLSLNDFTLAVKIIYKLTKSPMDSGL